MTIQKTFTMINESPKKFHSTKLSFYQYFWDSYNIGDIDPSYSMLKYIAQRWELNIEQKYWLAYLYATNYCGATSYFMIQEFPDFEMIDINRMQQWWEKWKTKLIFQSDRRWLKQNNQFIPAVISYKKLIGNLTQEQKFLSIKTLDSFQNYRNAMKEFSNLKYFGRFALFLYLEAIYVLTGYPMQPDNIDLKDAESSRNGIAYALGYHHLLTGKRYPKKQITPNEIKFIHQGLWKLIKQLKLQNPSARIDIWNVETLACAYHKYCRDGSRYIGYYLERQKKEILTMESRITTGIDWSLLWDYRCEHFIQKIN